MLAVMERKLSREKKWMNQDEILELLAISEASPGPFAINAATFVGYKKGKFLGSVLATLGTVLPSFLISVIIAFILKSSGDNLIFNAALKGISAGVSVIILMAFTSLAKKHKFTVLNTIIFLISVFLVFFNIVSIIYIIIIGAILGIIIGYIRDKKRGEKR